MIIQTENPPAGGADGSIGLSCLAADAHSNAPETGPAQVKSRNPRAVREAKRLLKLEFLHECAGGIAVHAALVQTFAEIGDTAGVCYAFKRLFAHASAAHPVYVEKFGHWPTLNYPPEREPTVEILNWIRSRNIAYAKARQGYG